MPYTGEIWSLVCALCWAIGVILFRLAVLGVPPLLMSLFKNSFACFLFAATWLLLPPVDQQATLNGRDMLLLAGTGVIGIALGDTLFLHALKRLGAGRNAILGCLFSPFVILWSFLFLGERFTGIQFAGFVIIFSGIVLAVYRKPEDTISREDLVKGTMIGIASVLCMALGMVTTKPLIGGASPVAISCVRLVGGVSGMLLYILARGQVPMAIAVFRGNLPWPIMITGAFFGSYLAVFTWILGFKYTTASVASILNQTSILFILLFAAIFLKERLSPLKVTGAALGFIGVTLILTHA